MGVYQVRAKWATKEVEVSARTTYAEPTQEISRCPYAGAIPPEKSKIIQPLLDEDLRGLLNELPIIEIALNKLAPKDPVYHPRLDPDRNHCSIKSPCSRINPPADLELTMDINLTASIRIPTSQRMENRVQNRIGVL